MINLFAGKDKAWLIARRDYLQTVLASGAGSKTHVGIEQGVFHEYAEMSQSQLKETLMAILYALFCLDPDNFPDPRRQKVMKISTVYAGA